MNFKNKVILITWASSGIGMATALNFWKEWASVIVNYLSSPLKAQKIVENIKLFWSDAIAIKCDISNEEDVKSMIHTSIKIFGKIDILINNAWISIPSPILKRSTSDWHKVMDTNLLGTFLCSKYVVDEMLKQSIKWKIINIGSINGTKTFAPDLIDYDISKAWMIALTKNFAKAFSPNIIVNAIAPWNINTNNSQLLSQDSYEEDIRNIYQNRFWTLKEVVNVILFLASEDSNYINWTVIYADGWFSC